MRKLSLILVLLISVICFGQKKRSPHSTHSVAVKTNTAEGIDSTSVEKPKWGNYVNLSVSMSNGNTYDTNEAEGTFCESSYPNIEFGFSKCNIMAGLAVGRRNFKGLGDTGDKLGDYFSEIRITPSFPLGIIDANVVFGAGTYLVSSKGTFIEYGSGISYTQGKYTYGISYSNFDGIDYISLGLTYNFKFK